MIGSGEYIGRDAAIEAMYKDAEANPNHTFWTSQFEALMDIPAADVRPVRRGKWTRCKNWTRCVCSACSWEITFVTGNSYNFCPNCGADMREEPPKEET